MEVLFATQRLYEANASERQRVKRYGKEAARRIDLRLQQLLAAESLAEMRNLPGRCHELTGDRSGHLALDLVQPYRLIIRPTADPPPEREGGGLDWEKVDSVTIVEIVDYH